jgi:hypothetical protein
VRECRAIPVYSLLLVCVLSLQLHTRPRVQRAPGVPHALLWAERYMHNSDELRREIAKPRLRTKWLFEK